MNLGVSDGFEFWALKLTVINVIVFVMTVMWPDFFYGAFTLVRDLALTQPWRFATSMFMHSTFTHLYFNMFSLAVFGSIYEKHVGSRTFLVTYFLGGLVAGIIGLIFYPAILGASGAIMAALGALSAFRPKQVVWAFGMPTYIIVAFFIWIIIDLAGFGQPDGVAHASHLAGLAYGASYGLWLRKERPSQKKPPKEKDPHDMPTERELEEWERQILIPANRMKRQNYPQFRLFRRKKKGN